MAGVLLASCNNKALKRSFFVDGDRNDSVVNKPSDHPVYDQLRNELDSAEIYNDKIIYGMWFEPHGATHNIIFHKNHTFTYNTHEFHDKGSVKDITIEGHFSLEGDSVVMSSDNGWKMKLRYWNANNNDDTKYLTGKDGKWDYYFVKGSD